MAIYSNILALKIPWTEEPGGLQSKGLQKAGRDLVTKPLPPPPLGFSLYTHSPLGCISPFPLPTISNTNARSLWSQVTLSPWRLLFLGLSIIQMTWWMREKILRDLPKKIPQNPSRVREFSKFAGKKVNTHQKNCIYIY